MKQEMYDFIDKCSNKENLPLFTEEQWVDLNQKYEKNEFRRVMVEYIINKQPPFPFKTINKNDIVDGFFKLCNDPISVTYEDKCVSKFTYKRKFAGLIFNGKSKYNKISDFFQRQNRYECDTKHNIAVMTSWKTGKGLYTVLNSFWTMKHKEVTKDIWHSTFNIAAHVASQFRPAIVKNIINHFKAKTYMDMSCGWGDRLLGFYGSNAEHYVGFDPSTKTFPIYFKQKEFYDNLLPIKKKVTLLNLPAEDVDYEKLPMVDLFFSSPPYFMAEKYENNPMQSWVRYKTIEDWQHKFLHVVLKKAWTKIKEGGYMLINISDIFKGKNRVFICDLMCDFIETLPDAHYIGYYGMKLSLRPNIVLDRETANLPYVEPIWAFRKSKDKQETINILNLFD